jgi:hypothetical protein
MLRAGETLRNSLAGSDAHKTDPADPSNPALAEDFGSRLTPPDRLKIKTGAYSPPRFSAPALKVLPKPGGPGRSSTFGQLVRRAEAGSKAKWMKSSVSTRCLAVARRVNEKGGRSIYLVDNKQGGIEFGRLMYTVPNLNYCGAF